MTTQTANGGLILDGLNVEENKDDFQALVSLDFSSVRGVASETMTQLLNNAWKQHPLYTLKLIFRIRDCRGFGKGERDLFRTQCLKWLYQNHQADLLANAELLPFYGRFDDLMFIPGKRGAEVMAHQLLQDLHRLQEASESKKLDDFRPSLAAKWSPAEGRKRDKQFPDFIILLLQAMITQDREFCETQLGLTESVMSSETEQFRIYRTKIRGPLIKQLDLVETLMCERRFQDIDYNTVPSCAMKRLNCAFAKRDVDRFQKWLSDLTEGKHGAKVNVKQLFAHEIVREYLLSDMAGGGGGGVQITTNRKRKHGKKDSKSCSTIIKKPKYRVYKEPDPLLEAQWKAVLSEVSASGLFRDSLVLSDVSGSMSSPEYLPLSVSIALGILISSCTQAPFHKQIITFETNPKFCELKGDTLFEQVQCVKNFPWGGSTNVNKAFELILQQLSQMEDLALRKHAMPKRLFVLSDMEFDQANSSKETNYEAMVRSFQACGLEEPPQIVFWNLAAGTCKSIVPVAASQSNTILLSGFSQSMLKSVLESGEVEATKESESKLEAKPGKINPWLALKNALDNVHFDPIKLA